MAGGRQQASRNREITLGMVRLFKLSKPAPIDMLLKRPHLLSLPNSGSNWEPNIQMPETRGEVYHSNHHTRVSGRLAMTDINPGNCYPTTTTP